MPYPQLIYRGNYQLTVGADYAGAHLRADYGGGYSETETVFPGLLTARLNYSALSKRVNVRLRDGETATRLNYIFNFYRARMDAGREPFVMRSPLDDKLYLWEFADDALEVTMVDMYLATTGLAVRQTYVRGVATNADGSVDEDVIDPDAI